jgi:hypothetical protein
MPIWAAFALLFVSYALVSLLVKPPAPPKPATLSEFDFPQDAEGTPKGMVFGDVWIEDWFVMSYGKLRSKAVKQSGSKK